ncbi:MAG TPA: NUDIX domain-containing protein [Acetobacteraceae bacterium]|nr:NUDIX domain-containing protein [Acetobacteraceae bacterium]
MKEPATPRPAATVLLLRDGAEGLEVFMVVRHHQIDFASGALVFPGGSVDPGDVRAAEIRGSGDPAALALRVAAIREVFEECGVLLARPRGQPGLVDAARLRAIEAAHREALTRGARGMAAVAEAEGLELATEMLTEFAHWITPPRVPKRFDTHFFLAPAPADHLAVHDGTESVDSIWIAPARAVEEAAAGRWKILFPTRLNLLKLAQWRTSAEAIAAARAAPVVTVLPDVTVTPAGRIMRIPLEAGYGAAEFLATDPAAM